jgi:hypothetical protein
VNLIVGIEGNMKVSRSFVISFRVTYITFFLVCLAIAIPSFIKARNVCAQNACINNLRCIDSAKEQWALASQKTNGEEVVIAEINRYLKGNTAPVCPQGGTYTYNVIGKNPECSGVSKMKGGPAIPHRLPEFK